MDPEPDLELDNKQELLQRQAQIEGVLRGFKSFGAWEFGSLGD